jgi:hypothetical protein
MPRTFPMFMTHAATKFFRRARSMVDFRGQQSLPQGKRHDQDFPQKIKLEASKMLLVIEVPEQVRADFVPARLWH